MPNKPTNTKEAIALLDDYSRAIPCGTAILAINHIVSKYFIPSSVAENNLEDQIYGERSRLSADEIRASANKLKPARVNLSFCDYIDIGGVFPPEKHEGECEYRIVLPLQALKLFIDPTNNDCPLEKNPNLFKEKFPFKNLGVFEDICPIISTHDKSECGKRNCLIKKCIRLTATHEIAHILDSLFNISLEIDSQKIEEYLFDCGVEIFVNREKYLKST